jgi:hypothetical protein
LCVEFLRIFVGIPGFPTHKKSFCRPAWILPINARLVILTHVSDDYALLKQAAETLKQQARSCNLPSCAKQGSLERPNTAQTIMKSFGKPFRD